MKLNGGWLVPVLALASLTLSSAAPCRTEDPCEGGPASGPWRLPILTLGMGAAKTRLSRRKNSLPVIPCWPGPTPVSAVAQPVIVEEGRAALMVSSK